MNRVSKSSLSWIAFAHLSLAAYDDAGPGNLGTYDDAGPLNPAEKFLCHLRRQADIALSELVNARDKRCIVRGAVASAHCDHARGMSWCAGLKAIGCRATEVTAFQT